MLFLNPNLDEFNLNVQNLNATKPVMDAADSYIFTPLCHSNSIYNQNLTSALPNFTGHLHILLIFTIFITASHSIYDLYRRKMLKI